MKTIKKLIFLLNQNERKRAMLLLIMIIIVAFLDMLGVASILPFIAVLTNPGLIETNTFLKTIYHNSAIFGVENSQDFLFVLGLIVFVLLIASNSFKALTIYAQVRFVQMRNCSISKRLIKGYLNQTYSWFLFRHSSDLGRNILSEVNEIVGNGISPLLELISKGMVTIAIVSLLVAVDAKLAFVIGFTLGTSYLLIFYFLRKYLVRYGEIRLKNNQLRFTTITEVLGAIKEVKVSNKEQIYIQIFSKAAKVFARTVASSQVISQLPRFILESIAFGGILLMILYLMTKTGSFSENLPIISLYAFAGYRLIPAIQQIYASVTKLTFVGHSVDKLHEDLQKLKPVFKNQKKESLNLEKKISLKNIHYSYPNSSKTTLKNINLTIPIKSTVGIVGPTGSGKTTVVDIILGLLEAQKGKLEVDGEIITSYNSRSWQKNIGYVPQNIYLIDDTVTANIAFGVDPLDVNQDLVEKVAKIANIHEFVISELPNQYQNIIGERGIKLSGGQCQRIGIARSLYNSPKVLILDEATSALDNITENKVMEAINNLNIDMTTIIIAHRLETLKNCNKIFILENGTIKKECKFQEIINQYE